MIPQPGNTGKQYLFFKIYFADLDEGLLFLENDSDDEEEEDSDTRGKALLQSIDDVADLIDYIDGQRLPCFARVVVYGSVNRC